MHASLAATDVARAFGRHRVLRGVTFRAHPGEMIGIVGENGAGKTTLLRILAGLLPASHGHVEVHGRLGYCPQEPQVHAALTVAQNLEWFAAAYRLDRTAPADALLERLALQQFRHALVRDLSGGTRQKLNLVLALMHTPTVLLLDEPYQGFDWETYQRFWALAEEYRGAGQTVVIISHLFYELARFDRVLRLQDGVLTAERGA
ncbi:MAG TPA: ABC transporter ATP-binding protein [bacterium]|nr:ABC transporter ATP-binding protein [bacterium]